MDGIFIYCDANFRPNLIVYFLRTLRYLRLLNVHEISSQLQILLVENKHIHDFVEKNPKIYGRSRNIKFNSILLFCSFFWLVCLPAIDWQITHQNECTKKNSWKITLRGKNYFKLNCIQIINIEYGDRNCCYGYL